MASVSDSRGGQEGGTRLWAGRDVTRAANVREPFPLGRGEGVGGHLWGKQGSSKVRVWGLGGSKMSRQHWTLCAL